MNAFTIRRFMSNFSKSTLYPSFNNDVKLKWSQMGNDVMKKTDFIFPVFLSQNPNENTRLEHLPLNFRVGKNKIKDYLSPLVEKGLSSVILFGSANQIDKNPHGSFSSSSNNPVIEVIPVLKKAYPHLNVICDVCLCSYTDSGQCFVPDSCNHIDHEVTVRRLSETALAYAQAGCDIVAPSDNIDHRVFHIKSRLNEKKLTTSIMSYSSKLASNFYGPFRNAANSGCNTSSRINQFPIGSKSIALRAIERDIEEGTDFIIMKPGLMGLDLIASAKMNYPNYPIFAYHVSGECAMLVYAAENGSINFENCLRETIISFKRAGCQGIITYFVPQIFDKIVNDLN